MHRPPYSVVFAALLVFAAASVALGQPNGKAGTFQEFDDAPAPAVAQKAPSAKADAPVPAKANRTEGSSAYTQTGPSSVKPASKGSSNPHRASGAKARATFPGQGKTIGQVAEGLRGIIAALTPSKQDLEKALVAVTSPPDSPSGRPGPPWKQSPQWVLR